MMPRVAADDETRNMITQNETHQLYFPNPGVEGVDCKWKYDSGTWQKC